MKLKLMSMALFLGMCTQVTLALFPNPWVTPDNPWDENIIGYQVTYQDGAGSGVWWDSSQPADGSIEDFPHGDGPFIWSDSGDSEGRADNGSTAQYYLEEMGTFTTDGKTFELRPETNFFITNPDNSTIALDTFVNAVTNDGDMYVDSLTFYERIIIGTESNVAMDFVVNDFSFDTNRYEVVAFLKVVEASTGDPLYGPDELPLADLTIGATNTFQLQTNFSIWNDENIQLGFRVSGTNASPTAALTLGSANVTVTDLFLEAPDFIAPDPDPLTWEVEPYTISDDKIGMELSEATDPSGVFYQIIAYKGPAVAPPFAPGDGFFASTDWVEDPVIVFEGLDPNQQYSFKGWARDDAVTVPVGGNKTGFTDGKSATTLATDNDAPDPDPAEIASATPSPISVWLVATPAIPDGGSLVQYNFVPANTNNNAVASGWQESNEFVLYGAVPEQLYTYTVQMRDLSAATNTTAVSAPVNVITLAAPGALSITNDLKGFTAGSTPSGELLTELANAGFEVASLDEEKVIFADTDGLTFGNYVGTNVGDNTFLDRNILRTIADDYANGDFTIDVTFSYSNAQEQVCFTGAGYGIQGQFNIPDFFIVDTNFYEGGGVNAILTETSAAWQKLFSFKDGTEVVPIFGNGTTNLLVYAPGVGSITNRVRLTYEAATTNVTYEIDYDADGVGGSGDFFADLTLGPIVATNVFNGVEPSKLYISAGAGTTLYDLKITASGNDSIAVDDLVITSVVGDTATLQWTGVSGQTYNVQYKTDLGAVSWTADGPNQDIEGSGILTPNSTVAGDEVFYRVESE